MRDHLRLCLVVLLFLLSISILACSNNGPNTNGPSPNIRSDQPTNGNSNSPAGNSNSAAKSEVPSFEGFHDIVNCTAIMAWAWDMNRPNDPIKLDIYDGNVLIGTATADGFRQDLLSVGKGNGKHGMYFAVPPQLKDGKKHTITIKYGGTDLELGNGPKELTCNFEQ